MTPAPGSVPETDALALTEAELLQRIGETVPAPLGPRYYALRAKCREGTLTPTEHKALTDETDQREIDYAACLMCAIELAHLRGTTLEAQMQALGILPYTQKTANGYRRMTIEEEWLADEEHEAEALAWAEATLRDVANEPQSGLAD